MNRLILTLAFMLSYPIVSYGSRIINDSLLIPIVKSGKYGYINKKGKWKIAPQFEKACPFTEGVAVVQKNGLFGYITPNGRFVISPIYDYAYSLKDGLARVWLDGKPMVLDTNGKTVFNIQGIKDYLSKEFDFIKVLSVSGKYGYINSNGKLIIDTIYNNLHFANKNLIVAKLVAKNGQNSSTIKELILRKDGKILVDTGRYRDIGIFTNNLCIAKTMNKYGFEKETIYIDTAGNKVFTLPSRIINAYNFSNNLALISVRKELTGYSSESYPAYIDLSGKIKFEFPAQKYGTNFVDGIAWVGYPSHWLKINTSGAVIDSFLSAVPPLLSNMDKETELNLYRYLSNDLVYSDYYFSSTGKKIEVEYDDFGLSWVNTNYRILYGSINKKWGAINRYGVLIVPFKYDTIVSFGQELGYILAETNNTTYLISDSGEIIFKQQKEKPAFTTFRSIYMLRGHFYAYSYNPKKPKNNRSGGWAVNSNYPRRASERLLKGLNKGLQIKIDPTALDTFYSQYQAFKAYFINNSTDTLQFPAQDGRLYAVIQAKDTDNEWHDIEYLPSSWCGNSYHNVYLLPGEYWEFTIPNFEGPFKTKLRIKLKGTKSNSYKDECFSAEFDGSISKAQFWLKQGYQPLSIMDPYFD